MSDIFNTSEVRLLLKKNNYFSKVYDLKAKIVSPNIKKLAHGGEEKIEKKFYELIIQELSEKNCTAIICSRKFYLNLEKFNFDKKILFIDVDIKDYSQLSSDKISLNINQLQGKRVLVACIDYFIRQRVVDKLKSKNIVSFDLMNILKNNATLFNEQYFFPIKKNIYPIKIPEIKIKDNIDVLLVDSPSRNLSLMPNGLAYVYNVLKKNKFKFDILDLDIITYHRFHSRRIYDEGGIIEINNTDLPDDPWKAEHYDFWIEKLSSKKYIEESKKNTEESEEKIINGIFEDQPILKFVKPIIDETLNEIYEKKPKIIGMSIQACNTPFAKILAKKIKKFDKNILIVVGGFSCYQADIGLKAFPDADYMCIGEADLTIGPLIEKLLSGERPFNLPGVLSKFDKPDYHKNFVPAPMIHDLDRIEAPKYDWTDLSIYRNYNDYQLVPIIASRGCRWSRCTFCAERFYWRIRSAENFVDELEWLVSQGTHLFMFNESDLNGKPERVLEICDEIIKRGLDKKIILTGQLRIHKKSTKEFFQKLNSAGFRALRFGVDAFSKNTLKLQQKGYTIEIIEQNLRDCSNAGISTEVNWVIGVPGETDEDVEEGIDLILRNQKYIGRLANINPLILSNGGVYWIDPEQHNIKFTEPKDVLYNKYPSGLPANVWYSEKPYIDSNIRQKRFKHIIYSLHKKGFPIGDWAQNIIKEIITASGPHGKTYNKKQDDNKKQDEYKYSPEFKNISRNNSLKFIEIHEGQKIYSIGDMFVSIPLNKEIDENIKDNFLEDDNYIKFKELKALKEHIKEANRFADTRGKYEANKKVNKNIYRVDSFSEEQSLKRDKIQLSNGKFNCFKRNDEIFIIDDQLNGIDLKSYNIDKIIRFRDHPHLISTFKGNNIVRYKESYYALPFGLRINWLGLKEDVHMAHIAKADNLITLFDQIEQNLWQKNKILNQIKAYFMISNHIIWRINLLIREKGFRYFFNKLFFLINKNFNLILNSFIYRIKNKIHNNKRIINKEINKISEKTQKKENIPKKPEKREFFVKELDEYKIYKMEGMYFAFSRGKKINFQEEDYLLNDDVIKDYSIDAVETKITELR